MTSSGRFLTPGRQPMNSDHMSAVLTGKALYPARDVRKPLPVINTGHVSQFRPFLKDNLDINDIRGTQVSQPYANIATRQSLKTDDIEGSSSSYQKFRSRRLVNPLTPEYTISGQKLGEIEGNKPRPLVKYLQRNDQSYEILQNSKSISPPPRGGTAMRNRNLFDREKEKFLSNRDNTSSETRFKRPVLTSEDNRPRAGARMLTSDDNRSRAGARVHFLSPKTETPRTKKLFGPMIQTNVSYDSHRLKVPQANSERNVFKRAPSPFDFLQQFGRPPIISRGWKPSS